MIFSLPYGTGALSLSIPDTVPVQIVRPPNPTALHDIEGHLGQMLDHPVSGIPLDDFLERGTPLTIVVPDKTRHSGCAALLPLLLRRIHGRGIPRESIRILFANGTHGLQTESEKRTILGDAVYESYAVYDHDPHDDKNLTPCGRTSRGTEVRINTLACSSRTVIAIGAVIHHYFAGFGGGPKMIVPGISGYSTALQNHRLTLTEGGDFNPNCREGVMAGNPVYEDIVEAIRLGPPVFFIGTLLDSDGNITDIIAGDPVEAHRKGAERVNRRFRVPIHAKTPTVIAGGGGYPRDCTMIQSHKALHHAYEAVDEGGTIICCAECRDGIGSPTFMRWFEYPSPEAMKRDLLEHYTLNGHTALALQKKLTTTKIMFVSMLDPTLVKKMGMIPLPTLDEGTALALKEHAGAPVTVIENGASCLPAVGYSPELEN